MPEILLVLIFGMVGGIAVGLQSPMASMITEETGPLESVFIVHLGGAIFSLIPLLILQGGGHLGQWRAIPWYALGAGFWGLAVISAVGYAFPRVGALGTTVLIVAGQMILATTLDHFGWLGAAVHPIDVQRVVGIIVLFIGVWLIMR